MAGRESEKSFCELQDSGLLKGEKYLNLPNIASRPNWTLLKLILLKHFRPRTVTLPTVLCMHLCKGIMHTREHVSHECSHVFMPTTVYCLKMFQNTSCPSLRFPSVALFGFLWLGDRWAGVSPSRSPLHLSPTLKMYCSRRAWNTLARQTGL